MIVHYDRTPYRATGRHGSRVQQVNRRRRLQWQQAKSRVRNMSRYTDDLEQAHAWERHRVRQEARGICPHSGETFGVCKRTDLCDCFDYPEHEHYRQ